MFVSNFKYFTIIILSLLFSNCNSRKKEELNADKQLKIIENLIKNNKFNGAKIKIDSFHVNFPRLVSKRKIAAALEDTIARRENSRSLMYCDSLLPLKKHEFDSISTKFRFEKDTNYQNFGSYVHKSQITEQNLNRNFIKCIVTEDGQLQLISNYTGTKIEHNRIEVRAGDIFTQSDSTNQAANETHYFYDENEYFERVTFDKKSAEDIVKFISNNKNAQIKVILKGKRKYFYNLNTIDKNAINDSFHLWIIKNDIIKLEKEIQKASLKVQKINFHKKNNI